MIKAYFSTVLVFQWTHQWLQCFKRKKQLALLFYYKQRDNNIKSYNFHIQKMYSKEYVRFITDFQNEHCPKSYVTVHLLKTHTNHLFNTADAKCPSFEVFHSNLK